MGHDDDRQACVDAVAQHFEKLRLPFDLNVNLQDDEIFLSAGGFYRSWSPGHTSEIVGLLVGSYCVVEHYRGRHLVRTELQERTGVGWETVDYGSIVFWAIFAMGPKSTKIVSARAHE